MKLLFRQRIFSWLDSYDIFDENGETVIQSKDNSVLDINFLFMIVTMNM